MRQRGTTTDNFHRWECDPKGKKRELKTEHQMKGVIINEAAKQRKPTATQQLSFPNVYSCCRCCCWSSSFSSSHFLGGKWIAGECAHRTQPNERKPNANGEENTSAGYSRLRKQRNHPLWDSNGRIYIPRFNATITCLAGGEGK